MVEVAGNASDTVAFISRTDARVGTGLFVLDGKGLRVIAAAGDPAAGVNARYTDFNQLRLLDRGNLYFNAFLEEPDGFLSAGVFRWTGSAVEPVIVPGDRGMGERVIEATIQYDVNEQGHIGLLARITSGSLIIQAPAVSEVLLYRGGRLRTLASADATLFPGSFDRVSHFAITFDQVHIDEEGIVSFYAATQQLPLGGIYYNKTGELYNNHKVVAQGDSSPLSSSDQFLIFGTFGFNSGGSVAFQTVTPESPFGSFFVQHSGRTEAVALAGRLRPDGDDIWHGFLLSDMNEARTWVFTDFYGLVQLAVYLGRLAPEPLEVVEIARETLREAEIRPMIRTALMRHVQSLDRAVRRNDRNAMTTSATALRTILLKQELAGEVPAPAVDILAPVLSDLLTVLTTQSGTGRLHQR